MKKLFLTSGLILCMACPAFAVQNGVIEGEVDNCILFRGVKVGKGTVLKNCIAMQDTVIASNCEIEYTIMDKEVSIASGKSVKGEKTFPVFVPAFKKIL